MKKHLSHPLVYCLLSALFVGLFMFACLSGHAQTINPSDYAKDSAELAAGTQIIVQNVPASYVPIVALISAIAGLILAFLSHFDIKLFKKASVILVLLCLGTLANAQTISDAQMTKYYSKHMNKAVLLGNEKSLAPVSISGNLWFAGPNVGLEAMNVLTTGFKNFEMSGSILPSFSYGIGFGQYQNAANGTYNIQPDFMLNAIIAGGASFTPANIAKGNFQLGLSACIYKYANVGFVRDFAQSRWAFIAGASFALSNFKPGIGSFIF